LKIDAHHHLWEFGRFDYGWITEGQGPLGRDFLPDDLARTVAPHGIDGTVLIQTINDFDESRWFCELGRDHELIRGVVAWVDLTAEDVSERLDQLQAIDGKLVGIRHVVQGEPDPDWVVRPDVLRGLSVLEQRGLTFDLLFLPKHLRHVPALAVAMPNLKMVIDHIAKPDIRAGAMDGWAEDFKAAAQFPNITCKLSGMITEADHQRWQPQDLRPYVDHALNCFGPERLMFGSDWPVCLLAGSYDRMIAALEACVPGLSSVEHARLFGGAATEFYRLAHM